jgi:putative endonuclease
MLDSDCLVFIEVRYRASTSFTPASHTVDRNKQNKIIRTAAIYVARNGRFRTHTMRFDVVGVQGTHEIAVNWLQDAFRPNNSTL